MIKVLCTVGAHGSTFILSLESRRRFPHGRPRVYLTRAEVVELKHGLRALSVALAGPSAARESVLVVDAVTDERLHYLEIL